MFNSIPNHKNERFSFLELADQVFGIDVVELEDKKQKTYILANNIENDSEHPHQDWYVGFV